MPLGLGGSNYWNPQGPADPYGGDDTQWGRTIQEQNPDAAYYRYGRNIGVADDNSAFSRWFKQQFPQANLGYKAFSVSNPLTANIVDYMKSLGGYDDWFRQFSQQAPQLRGLDPSSRGGGPSRWISR